MEDISSQEHLVNETEPCVQIRRRNSNKEVKNISNIPSDESTEHCLHIDSNNSTLCGCISSIFLPSLKRFEYRLYLTLLLTQVLPTIYKSIRIYYLGNLPNSWGVNIASQLIWVNLIQEVFQEALILPLYCLIGDILHDHDGTKNRIKIGMMVTFLLHTLLAIVIGLSASPLTKLMAQKESMIHCTIQYVRLELVSIPFESINQFAVVMFTMFNNQLHLYVILVVRLFMSILLDTFLLNDGNYSLNLGVNGIAYGNIATSTTIFVYCIIVTWKQLNMNLNDLFNRSMYEISWLRNWINIGFFSGLDSFIRNIFYILCVIRMMNVIEQQGVYWRANEFIWNWLLLPFIPLSNVLKQDTSLKTQCINHKLKMVAYVCFVFILACIWFITIPLWKLFFHYVMNVNETDVHIMYNLVLILSPIYVTFMINTLLDSVLYGKGVTKYLAIQSGITNSIVNLPAFILFVLHIYIPNIHNIALLFGIGIAVDNIITFYLYYKYLKSTHYEI